MTFSLRRAARARVRPWTLDPNALRREAEEERGRGGAASRAGGGAQSGELGRDVHRYGIVYLGVVRGEVEQLLHRDSEVGDFDLPPVPVGSMLGTGGSRQKGAGRSGAGAWRVDRPPRSRAKTTGASVLRR